MRALSRFGLALACGGLAVSACAGAPSGPEALPKPEASAPAGEQELASLAWLAGEWIARDGELETRESWRLEPDELVGVNVSSRAGERVHGETLAIRAVDGVLRYFAHPEGQAPAHFDCVEVGEAYARFENLAHDWPTRIVYRREGETMHAEVSGPGPGGERKASFRFSRVEQAAR